MEHLGYGVFREMSFGLWQHFNGNATKTHPRKFDENRNGWWLRFHHPSENILTSSVWDDWINPIHTRKNMKTWQPNHQPASENTSKPAILKSLPILIIHIHRWLLASSQDQETYRAEWMKDIFCRIKSPFRPSQKKYGYIYSKRTKKEQQALRSGTICRRHWDPNILSKWMKPCQPCLITGLVHISQS